jgi:actin-related protein
VRVACPELLFDPSRFGSDCSSLQQQAWNSVVKSDLDIRKDMCKNIVMSGGSTMFEGIADRFHKELIKLAPANAEINIVASADRKYAVWKGGSTLATLTTFKSSWVTAEEYQEYGASIIHRKCA